MTRRADGVLGWLQAPWGWIESLSAATQDRLVGFGLALPSGLVLAIARMLTPDPAGMGTHRQLGLGGCAILTTTGVPCPMCGMTTTFSHLAHLEPAQAAATQPFGLVLFACTVAAFSIGVADLIRPRGRWRRALAWIDRHESAVAGSLLLGLVLGWAYKIIVVLDFLSKAG